MFSRISRLQRVAVLTIASTIMLGILMLPATLVHAVSPPTISATSPSYGSIAGGDSITITGTTFAAGDTVTVGGVAATNVTVLSTTSMTALTPAAASPGIVNVSVSDTSGNTAILTGGFVYTNSSITADQWTGTSSTAWSTAGNWSTGAVPTSSNIVIINGGANQPTISMTGAYGVYGMVIGSGSSSTLTVAAGSSSNVFSTTGDLVIGKSGTLTHAANTATQVNSLVLSVGGNTMVATGGSINLDSKGYSSGNGPGAAATGGASYGGLSSGGKAVYGSITQPSDLGSGGGGAPGGGAMKLTTTGTTTVNGTITAQPGGYGTGGSVWVVTNTFAGNGMVTVSGNINYSGSGGRMAIYYTTNTFSGSLRANGADGSSIGAGAGTIFTRAASETYGDLTIDNNGRQARYVTPVVSTNETYDNIKVTQGAIYSIGSGQTVTTTNYGAAAGSAITTDGRIQLSGTLQSNGATLTNYYVYDSGNYQDSNLTIGNGTTFELDTTTASTPWTLNGSLTIANGGTLTTPSNTTAATYAVNVQASGSITVASGGIVTEAGKGYAANNGPGKGLPASGSVYANGASYGGLGGAGSSNGNAIASTYGSSTQPTDIGSGGGNTSGGAGGGAIQLASTSDSITVNGTITADAVAGSGTYGSGGSGGSVWLSAATVAGSGTITAKGGNGTGSGSTASGGGGGGRIAFSYNNPLTVASVSPSSGPVAGGNSVTISGTSFGPNTTVKFAGNSATTNYLNSTTLSAITPASTSAGPADVTATNEYFSGTVSTAGGAGASSNSGGSGTIYPAAAQQTATLANGYSYQGAAPTISNLSPRVGASAGGTTITITGTNFLSGATVLFDSTAATSVTYVNSTTLTVVAPAHVAGDATVTVTNPDSQSVSLAHGFTFYDAPTITNISPATGSTAGGDSVTISGSGFYGSPSVSFGGSLASAVIVNNANSLTVTTPAHVAGAVTVQITNPDGQSVSHASGFTYINPPPTINTFYPTSGIMSGGTTVTLTGSGFDSTQIAYFGGVAGTTVSASNTSLIVRTPAAVPSDVTVTVSGSNTATATAVQSFRYVPAAYAFTTAPLNLHATESGQFTVQSRDKSGNAVTAPYDIPLTFDSTSTGASFSTDGTTWGASSATLPANATSLTLYYRDSNVGSPQITVHGLANIAVSQTEQIQSKYVLLVTGVSDPITAGTPSSVTIQATDWQGQVANDYTGTLHFSSSDTFAALPSDFTITSAMHGRHTFVNGVTMVTNGEQCVTATDTSQNSITGAQCNITVTNGYSGSASKLAIITDPQSAETDTATSAITVQVQDSAGNPAPVPVDTTVYINSSSNSGSFSSDGVANWSASQPFTVTVAAHTSSVNVFYKDSTAGKQTLSFRDQSSQTDSGLSDTSQVVTIGVGPPAALAFTSSGTQPYGSWQRLIVSLEDSAGKIATNPDQPQPVYLTSTDANVRFSASASGNNASNSLNTIIPVGGNQAVVYVYRGTAATSLLTASDASPADGATGLTDASQTMSFVAPNPSGLLVSAPTTVSAGQAATVTVSAVDSQGNAAVYGSDVSIHLDNTAGGSFSTSSPNWSPISSVTLPAGQTSVSLYYKTTTAGTATITAQATFASLVQAQTTLQVTAATLTQFVFMGAASSLPVNDANGITVNAEDMYGNLVTVDSQTPVYLYTTSGTGGFAATTSGPFTATSVMIPAGSSSVLFYYRDTTLGQTATISASDQSPLDNPDVGITNASQTVQMTGQTAASLAFTSAPQSVEAGQSSGDITIEARTASGQPATQGNPLVVTLTSNSTGNHAFTATSSPGAPTITQVTIPAGSSSATVYYHDTKAGSPQLLASGNGLSTQQAITITPSTAQQLEFITSPQTGTANQPSAQMEIAIGDMYGNITTTTGSRTINLASSCGDGTFSSSSTNWSPITQLTMSANGSTAFFYYKSALASCNLTVSSGGLADGTQTYQTTGGVSQIAFLNPPVNLTSGQTASLTVTLEDSSGNIVSTTTPITVYGFADQGSYGVGTTTIPPGSSMGTLTYTAGAAGTTTLSVRDESSSSAPDTNLIDGSATVTVVAGNPAALSLTPNNDSVNVNVPKQFTIHLTNSYGADTPSTTDTTVQLGTNDTSGHFYASSDTSGSPITSLIIPANTTIATFYYVQTATGSSTITASGTPYTSGTSSLTVTSAVVDHYGFVPNTANGEAGQQISLTLQAFDQYGNVVSFPTGQRIYLTASAGTLSGSGYDAPSHSVTIPSSTSALHFSYSSTTVGTHPIVASDTYPVDTPDTSIGNATVNVTIIQGNPAKLAFTSPPATFDRGGVSNPITVAVENNSGTATPVSAPLIVTLHSSSPTAQFAATSSGPWTDTTVTIPPGDTNATVYYRDNVNTGNYNITASAPNYSQISQAITVTPGAPDSLYFINNPQSIPATHTSARYSLGVNNRFGYPTIMPATQPVALSSSSPTGQFAANPPAWGQTSVTWPANASTATFYYRDSNPGTATLNAAVQNISATTQPVIISQQYFDHFIVTNIADPQAVNTPSSAVIIAADSADYTVQSYAGRIHFTSTDPLAQLPADYSYQPYSDKGIHTFTNGVKFGTPGEQSVIVTDTTTGQSGAQTAITVTGNAPQQPVTPIQPSAPVAPPITSNNPGTSGSQNTGQSNGNEPGGTPNGQAQHTISNSASGAVATGTLQHARKLLQRIFHSKAAPYTIPGILFLVLLLLAAVLLYSMYRELRAADRLVAITKRSQETARQKAQFMELAAHHLRTPATIIQGAVELLVATQPHTNFDALKAAARQLTTTINTQVSTIASQLNRSDDPTVIRNFTVQRLYGSPLFWLPVIISIGLTVLVNTLARGVAHITVVTYVYQLCILAIGATVLYIVLRGYSLHHREYSAQTHALQQQQMLDSTQNTLIATIPAQLTAPLSQLRTAIVQLPASKSTAMLTAATSRLDGLLDSLRLLATIKTTTVNNQKLSLQTCLTAASNHCQEQVQAKHLTMRTTGDSIALTQDKRLLSRVLTTILDNACAFADPGTTIDIMALATGDHVDIVISDHGTDMPASITLGQLHPFAPGSDPLHDTHQGIGINLYLDSLIMQHLGGELHIDTIKGGAAIRLHLPLNTTPDNK